MAIIVLVLMFVSDIERCLEDLKIIESRTVFISFEFQLTSYFFRDEYLKLYLKKKIHELYILL